MESLEKHFSKYRKQIVGINAEIETPFGDMKKIVYADWVASGRCYEKIENEIKNEIMPYVSNTHTESSGTGKIMTQLYAEAKFIIKQHVNADDSYAVISSGSGMTGVVCQLQRILGLKVPEPFKGTISLKQKDKPIIFISHMEHHSNQISWMETIADVEIIPVKKGLFSLKALKKLLEKHKSRKVKIAVVTACSNVTGEFLPYQKIAKLMHKQKGYCFVDFAACAPYVDIDVNPSKKGEYLDAIYYSTHKFLGGPGATGILIFKKGLYKSTAPDNPGGGTVDWTNCWGGYKYIDDIEVREDGGTPPFLQTIKAAMCHRLKEEMGTENILQREKALLAILIEKLKKIEPLHILGHNYIERLGVISFYIEGLHYDLAVRMLNDYFGIQARGGCSCAGTYGHYLLNIGKKKSKRITDLIDHGDTSKKPGWVRISLHPTMREEEVVYIAKSIKKMVLNHKVWSENYKKHSHKNSFFFVKEHKKPLNGDSAERYFKSMALAM